MDLLRNLFFLNRIYSRPTILRIAINYFLILCGISLYSLFIAAREKPEGPGPWVVVLWLVIPAAVYTLARAVAQYYIASLSMSDDPETDNRYEIRTAIYNSAMSYELEGADHIKMIMGQNGSWQLYTATFDFYHQTKYGSYLARESFYTVFEGLLTRPVPHLIFDARRAKGRQYKTLYLQSQRLQLEGGFEKYFDVYSPEHYQIDTLSFITPDVMEALIALRDYDIELVDDRILCAGPLMNGQEQQELQRKSLILMQELNHNLKTYRDDRLSKDRGKTGVTPFAQTLLKNPRKYLPELIIAIAMFIGLLYYYTRAPASHVGYGLPMLIVGQLILALYHYFNIVLTNRRLTADFNKYYQR